MAAFSNGAQILASNRIMRSCKTASLGWLEVLQGFYRHATDITECLLASLNVVNRAWAL